MQSEINRSLPLVKVLEIDSQLQLSVVPMLLTDVPCSEMLYDAFVHPSIKITSPYFVLREPKMLFSSGGECHYKNRETGRN
jgi:hypothetical protein